MVVIHNDECIGYRPITVKAGSTILLDAEELSEDPDDDKLSFFWWQQPEIGHLKLDLREPRRPIQRIHIPADAQPDEVHIICEAHDDGPFHLVGYRRVIIKIVND